MGIKVEEINNIALEAMRKKHMKKLSKKYAINSNIEEITRT